MSQDRFLPVCLIVPLLLVACSGGGGSGDDSGDTGSTAGDGDIRLATEIIGYGRDAYSVQGDVSPGVYMAEAGESVTFSITPDANSRIYAVEGCNGVLSGNQYTIASASEACTVTIELYRQSAGSTITAIAGGGAQSVLLADDGTVLVVGANPDGETCVAEDAPFSDGFVQLENLSPMSAIQACSNRTFLRDADGNVSACGWNQDGQLGIDDSVLRQYGPAPVVLSNVNAVRCAAGASFARTDNGDLYAFGRHGLGLGIGDSTSVFIPTRIEDLTAVDAFDSGGVSGVAAIGGNGDLHVWGDRANGQLGDGFSAITVVDNGDGGTTASGSASPTPPQSTPLFLNNLGPVQDVASGGSHTLVLLGDGSVWGWGRNHVGQLGTGSTDDAPLLPTEITTLQNIVAIDAVSDMSVVLDDDGRVYTFGSGSTVLGAASSDTPLLVRGLPAIEAIHTGGEHVLALATDGSVWGWGNVLFNQLAIGPGDQNIGDPILIFDGDVAAVPGASVGSTNSPDDGGDTGGGEVDAGDFGSLQLSGSGAAQFPAAFASLFEPASYSVDSAVGITEHRWRVTSGADDYVLSVLEGATVTLLRTTDTGGGSTSTGFVLVGNAGVTIGTDGTVTFTNVGPLQGTLDDTVGIPAELFLEGTLTTASSATP